MIPINESDVVIMIRVGQFFTAKWRKRLGRSGRLPTLLQMKKQGIPPEIAVAMLYGTGSPPPYKEAP